MGRERQSAVHHRGSWVPSLQIFMPRSLLANKLHDTWKDTSEHIGSAMWLRLSFTFHPTVFSAFVTYLLTALFVEDFDRLFDSFNSVKRAAPCKILCSPLRDNSPHNVHWTKASKGIKNWIFLNDGKPAFK